MLGGLQICAINTYLNVFAKQFYTTLLLAVNIVALMFYLVFVYILIYYSYTHLIIYYMILYYLKFIYWLNF